MNIILCGGGTAGHVNPAIAIAEEIKKRDKNSRILFIGREEGRENELVTKAGFNVTTLNVKGINRKVAVKNVKNIFLALKAKQKSEKIISDFAPDIVVGTGGYVCYPVIKAAYKLGIPRVIHESNIYPGLTTRLLARNCNMILLNNKKTKDYLPKNIKYSVVGNPLRKEFRTVDREKARKSLGLNEEDIQIVSFGGSIGAEKMNETIMSVMKSYEKNKNIHHIHGVGKRFYKKSMNKKSDNQRIVPYINDMSTYLASADIVITRAGAMTLSEIEAIGIASIIIPSPNVTNNHQYKNAKLLSDSNAAILIEEKDLSSDKLLNNINEFINSPQKRKLYAEKIKKFNLKNSEKEIVDCLNLTIKS